MTSDTSDPRRSVRRLNGIGLVLVVIFLGGFGGWGMTTQLAGAIIAPGAFVVETNVQSVEHATGGIVSDLLVREGSSVEAGQTLLRLDATSSLATLAIVEGSLETLLLREARLVAERDGMDTIALPEELTPRSVQLASAFSGEQRLLQARRNSFAGERAQVTDQLLQLNEEIRGLTAQQAAAEAQLELAKSELANVTELYANNLVTLQRVTTLRREEIQLEGQIGQLTASLATTRSKISETQLRGAQLEEDFLSQVLSDLQETQGRMLELRERQRTAQDQLRRLEILASASGVVQGLAVVGAGGVVGAGETIMQIVPGGDALVAEAKIAPQSIDQIFVGANVDVRVLAADQRTNSALTGTITRISADVVRDPAPNGASYYLARVEFTAEDAVRIEGMNLSPGAPVEVYVATEMRTPVEYLLAPLQDQIARTFRER